MRRKHKQERPEIAVVPKGWGFEKIIVNNNKYCGKLLYIIKDKSTSLHYHKLKDETFYIQSGKVRVYYTDERPEQWMPEGDEEITLSEQMQIYTHLKEIVLNAGDAFHVPIRRVHQIVAIEETQMFEFSTQHFDEDSIRIIKGD